MARSHLNRRIARGACALAASACVLLVIAAATHARPADTWPQPVVHNSAAPTVVKQTVPRPASNDGPDTITLVLIAIGAAAALLGAGYLGARIARRTARTGT
jgi:hypothetical protein